MLIAVGLLLALLIFTGGGLDSAKVDTVHAGGSLGEPNLAPPAQEAEPTFSPPLGLMGAQEGEVNPSYSWIIWVVGIVVVIAVGAYFIFRKK